MHRSLDLLMVLIFRGNTSKRNKAIEWDGECETFQKLKEICTSFPIRAYADFTKLFKLYTDACILGLEEILYKNQDGIDRVIGYASRTLSNTQFKYPAGLTQISSFEVGNNQAIS